MSLQLSIKTDKISQDSRNRSNKSTRNSLCNEDSGYVSFNPQSINNELHSNLTFLSTGKFYKSRFHPYRSKWNYKSNNNKPDAYQNFLKNIPNKMTAEYPKTEVIIKKSKLKYIRSSFQMELRSHHKRQIELKTSPVHVIPHKNNNYTDNLFSSPLVAVPILPFNCEPTIDSTRIKIIIPQSTPCIVSSAILSSPLCNVDYSPITYKTSPFDTVNFKKLSDLSISKYTFNSERSKPRKLDFSKRAILKSFQKHKASIDYTGKETIDIVTLLGEKSNYPKIVSKILDYLNPKDLCSMNMVSKSWKRICINDIRAQERRIKYIVCQQNSKENLVRMSKRKLEEIQVSPISRYPRRGLLTAVPTNLLQEQRVSLTPSSPPVSPSKVIFHSFIKAGRSLSPYDQLVPCPHCKFACHIKNNSVGTCSRQSCPMEEFCLFCSSKLHAGQPCKMPLLATPTKRRANHQSVVGTKECKRNLRRISRLI